MKPMIRMAWNYEIFEILVSGYPQQGDRKWFVKNTHNLYQQKQKGNM